MSKKNNRRNMKRKVFFLNGKLYRSLHINRPRDEILMWSYEDETSGTYQYSYVLANMETAFTTTEVAKMLERTPRSIQMAVARGDVETPAVAKAMKGSRPDWWYWSEQMILDYHDYLCTVSIGRPRKDGRINVQNLPTRAELRALMRNEEILYVKRGDEFVPTWKA